MLYAKYESYVSCGFRKNFLKITTFETFSYHFSKPLTHTTKMFLSNRLKYFSLY